MGTDRQTELTDATMRRRKTPTRFSCNSVPLVVMPRLPNINVQIQPEKWEVVIAVTLSGQARCGNGYATFTDMLNNYLNEKFVVKICELMRKPSSYFIRCHDASNHHDKCHVP